MKSWLAATTIVGVALVVFVFALLVVMTIILVNNAMRASVRTKK